MLRPAFGERRIRQDAVVEDPVFLLGVDLNQMTFEQLQSRGQKMFGRYWHKPMSQALGVHLSRIYRWEPKDGIVPVIPRVVDMWFEIRDQRAKMERLAKSLTR